MKLDNSAPKRVFYYFERLSAIPRGSGNMKGVADFCESFAKEHSLKYIRDDADNVIIFKDGSVGFENSEPIILQGHLDMVCQKTADSNCDFLKDGIDLYVDGDYIKANGTTLGADNGIAVAMVLAILESDAIAHPPIEAVFTVDEEIGMLGALKLDMSVFSAKRMINLDSEEESVVTVSCAGGSDLNVNMPISRVKKSGSEVTLTVKGLRGGHSGVEINSGRVNADLLAGRILDTLSAECDFDVISICGGDKANAIPNRCEVKLCAEDTQKLISAAEMCFAEIKKEISHRESDFAPEIVCGNSGEFDVFEKESTKKLMSALMCVPNGVIEMSAEIDGLVETSLNLGILNSEDKAVKLCISLRSNKKTAQAYLQRRLETLFDSLDCEYTISGYYPPWEFKDNSELRDVYCKVYSEHCGKEAKVEAIHAGLECGVFSSGIDGLDCISVGPEMHDIHTTDEELSISSTNRLFEIIKDVLKRLK